MFAKETGKGMAAVWFKFFLDAGIPPSDAGNYAVTFTEHRIQPDMLSELTKDYLADMGITVLGDVIAILKHARIEHTKKSKEQALKCSGLTLQTSASAVDVPATNNMLPTTIKRPNTKPVATTSTAAATANSTWSLQKLTFGNPARGSNVAVTGNDSARRWKTTATTTAAGGAANITRPQDQRVQPVRGASLSSAASSSRLQTSGSSSGLTVKSSSAAQKSSVSAVKPQSTMSLDLTLKKTVTAVPSTVMSSTLSSKTLSSSIFSRLGDKMSSTASLVRSSSSSAEKTGTVRTLRDRLGPAASEAVVEPSMKSRQTAMRIPVKRKLTDESTTLITAANATAAVAVAKLNTKSSVKSRLGEPVTCNAQPMLTIPYKRKPADETVAATVVDRLPSKTAKLCTKLSIKSRLGESVAVESQPRLKLPSNRKLATTASDNGDLVSEPHSSVFSRLGPSRIQFPAD